jgi:hypothetical protein
MEIAENPDRALQIEKIERFIEQYQNNPQRAAADVYTIPVVVHVVHRNAQQNISEDQILSQIAILNEDFRRMNSDADDIWPQAADSEIEFCLANLDPDGNPTNGITRTSTTVNSFNLSNRVKFTNQGGHDAWPSGDYLNFWVCNLAGTLLGYAQFPGGNPATDGIVCDFNYVGNIGTATMPYHLGRTATHEVGHWLGLRHIWGDGGCGVDDNIADTPLSDASNGGCNIGHISCGTVDMVQNYMDYTNDACMNLFTEGQKTRMRSFLSPGGSRESLVNSTACILADPTCDDGIQNGDETDVDCGGPDCPACPTCDDGIQNGDETGIDCGGPECPDCPTCDDGVQNGDETGIDCGGSNCIPCCELEIIEIIVEHTTCGEDNALVEIFTSGGFDFVEYSIDGVNYFDDFLFLDVAADNYTAYARDQNNCAVEMNFEVFFSQEIEVEIIAMDPTCGEDNGSIQLQIFNAVNPRVSIDQGPFQNTNVFEDLPAGDYLIDVIDDNDCEWISGVALENASSFEFVINKTDATCANPVGSLSIDISSGNGPFAYAINNGPFQDDNTFENLSPNEYLIMIQDGSGCLKSESISILDLNTLTAGAIVTSTTCGRKNGAINVIAAGGIPPYTYSLNNGPFENENIYEELSTNTYSVHVKDAEDCIFEINNLIISESDNINVEINKSDVLCHGEATGSIQLLVDNGNAPFDYLINQNIVENGILEFIPFGEYEILVTDIDGCEFFATINIEQPDPLIANIRFENNQLRSEVNGGVMPYRYQWSDGSSEPELNSPIDSAYSLIVTDANDCMVETFIQDFTSSNQNLFKEGLIQLMPNPASDYIQLVFSELIKERTTIEVIDINGRTLIQKNHESYNVIQIDIADLSAGTYFIRVVTNEKSGVSKFVKL